jgi:hypothetical protein
MMVKRDGGGWRGGGSATKIEGMIWRRVWLFIRLVGLLAAAILLVSPEWPAFGDAAFKFDTIVGRERKFDFITWTIGALSLKAQAVLADTHHYLSSEAEAEFVRDYLERIYAAQVLEAEVERIYADPSVDDAAAATAELLSETEVIRRDLAWRQPLAEAIVQQQVASLLIEEGLDIGGMTWPPVMMTMSPVPYMMIVSPRDRIAQVDAAALVPGLSTEAKEEMEDAVFEQLDQSALVVPIGGLGTYPAMIRETASIDWLAEVTAHEWTHHWLSFKPLGVRYLESPEMRTINETVASLVDLEIGPRVIARFYPAPALVAQEIAPTKTEPTTTPGPPAFDFDEEMAETRRTVDWLLAQGEIEAAETYMEQRRRVFVNHGYLIRKLNQAYFAFYGGYAAEPGGAAGADPIGPMLRSLREHSPSLRDFLEDVGGVTSFEALATLYREKVGEDPALLMQ